MLYKVWAGLWIVVVVVVVEKGGSGWPGVERSVLDAC